MLLCIYSEKLLLLSLSYQSTNYMCPHIPQCYYIRVLTLVHIYSEKLLLLPLTFFFPSGERLQGGFRAHPRSCCAQRTGVDAQVLVAVS